MVQNFFTYLPSEIITNILLRLSVRSIAISKCVCKPWRYLLEADYFVNSHLSKSPAVISLLMQVSLNCFKVVELEDELDLDQIAKFDFPDHPSRMHTIHASANGLFLLITFDDMLYVCNPITREFVELDSHPELRTGYWFGFGIGASKISGQYKVVSVVPRSNCHYVYSLGRGSWRRIEVSASFELTSYHATFVDGNLHWMASTSDSEEWWVCCFDVDIECFSTISAPQGSSSKGTHGGLCSLRDCLCFCDASSEHEAVIWLAKDKSWTKEVVITLNPDYVVSGFRLLWPFKMFENGDVLIACFGKRFMRYSIKTKTSTKIDDVFHDCGAPMSLFTPSFLSLKTLGLENVIST